MSWFSRRKPEQLKPIYTGSVLTFVFRQHPDGRFRASITNIDVDDVLKEGWSSLAEMESSLPRTITNLFSLSWGKLVMFTSYDPQSRTMFILTRSKSMDWQSTKEGKLEIETLEKLARVKAGESINRVVEEDGKLISVG